MPDVSSGTAAPPSRPAVGPGAGRISLPKPLTSFIGTGTRAGAGETAAPGQLPGHADRAGRQRQDQAVHRPGRGGGRRLPGRRLFRPARARSGSGTGAIHDRPEHRVARRPGPAADGAPGQPVARAAAPDRAGQLRASAGRRPGGDAAARGDQGCSDPGQQPLVASRFRRAGMPGPAARGPGGGRPPDGCLAGRLRVGAPVRRAGRRRGTGIHSRRRERGGDRADRPQARRPAAGHRAGGGAG